LEVYYHYCHCGVRGVGHSKGEKQLLIVNEKGEFDQDVLAFVNNFKTEYERLLEAHNGGQCAMFLIKNLTTTKKGN
jgi:hypothetical protein